MFSEDRSVSGSMPPEHPLGQTRAAKNDLDGGRPKIIRRPTKGCSFEQQVSWPLKQSSFAVSLSRDDHVLKPVFYIRLTR